MVVPVPSSSVVPFRAVWTRAPKASGYLCVDSPCLQRQLAWPLGIVWGLNPGTVCTASAPGPLFPSLLSSLLTLLPPVSSAQPASRALECCSGGKGPEQSGKGSSEIDHSWPRTGPLPHHPDQAATCQHWTCPGHACSKGSS